MDKISDNDEEDTWGQTGDVKYHLGTTHDKKYEEFDHSIKLVSLILILSCL